MENKNVSEYRVTKLEDENTSNKNALIDYRVSKLEEAVGKLSVLSDVIIRWDALLSSQGNLFDIAEQRNKQAIILEEHDIKIKDIKDELKGLQKFMYKCTGALIIISIIIQLFGPIIIKKALEPTSAEEISQK